MVVPLSLGGSAKSVVSWGSSTERTRASCTGRYGLSSGETRFPIPSCSLNKRPAYHKALDECDFQRVQEDVSQLLEPTHGIVLLRRAWGVSERASCLISAPVAPL